MQDIKKIVVPVDFHQHTNDIADLAVNMAGKFGAQLTFVHVVEHFAKIAGYYEGCPTCVVDAYEEINKHAQKKMDALLERNKGACPGCTGVVIRGEGDAAGDLVDYAKDQKADLIVIGTHGRKGIEHVLLGSVADSVLKQASCPILLFNPYKGDRGYKIGAPIGETVQPV
jgi:nucleotide-binding universal stress UspA family protein